MKYLTGKYVTYTLLTTGVILVTSFIINDYVMRKELEVKSSNLIYSLSGKPVAFKTGSSKDEEEILNEHDRLLIVESKEVSNGQTNFDQGEISLEAAASNCFSYSISYANTKDPFGNRTTFMKYIGCNKNIEVGDTVSLFKVNERVQNNLLN